MTETDYRASETPVLVLAEKRCGRCGEVKPLSAFYRQKRTKDGRAWACIDCARAAALESAAQRRAEMGEEAWLAQQRERMAASRRKRGMKREREYSRAQFMATRRLIEAHRKEYDALLAAALYELGRGR